MDYDPAESYPLLIYLGMGDGRGDYAFQAVYNGLREAGALSRFILVVPQANGRWWDEDVEPVLNRVLTAVLKTLSVDTNRVFLAGSSNGGMGTIYFGTRLPDRFAGLAVNMGYPVVDRRFLEKPQNLEVLRNLRTARVFLNHGASDDWVTPEGDRQVAEILRGEAAEVVQQEMPNRKHDIEIREVVAQILKTFATARRNPYPKHIDFTLADPAYARCFWLEAVGAAAGDSFQAEINGNTIDVRTDTRGALRIYLDQAMIDLGREVVVRVNDREAFRGLVRSTVEDLVFTLAETMDTRAIYGARLEIDL
jgi:predicted esterase